MCVLSHVFSFLLAGFILFMPKSSCGISSTFPGAPIFPHFLKRVCVYEIVVEEGSFHF